MELKDELTCINCIYCEKDNDTKSGFICHENGCEIDDPDNDFCNDYFVLVDDDIN